MEVRAAAPGDIRGIAEAHVRTWQEAYRHAFPAELLDGLSVEGHEEWWRGVVENGPERVWVAVEGDVVLGFVSVGPSRTEADVAELYALYVLPEAWGSGAGTALMRTAIDWFLAEEHVVAMLWVLEDSPRARRFYEREGWRADGGRTAVVRGVEVREALYRLSLAGA
jgi:GNAT superfamily N-acetyltransferase